MSARFDEAWQAARDIASAAARGYRVLLVRDILGRVSLIVDDRSAQVEDSALERLTERLNLSCSPFVASECVLRASSLFVPEEFFGSSDAISIDAAGTEPSSFEILDRGIVGAEWSRVSESPSTRRATLYGFKGGVGRSVATFMLAKELARRGKSVLVADLDLESPGVGVLLQSEDEFPDFGLLDHIAEDAVGNAEDLDLITRSSQIRGVGNGEVWVAPARGRPRQGYDYLPKLNRAYADVPPRENHARIPFATRLERALLASEEEVTRRSRRPDVVLLDSRAGVHDVAAVAITQLSDMSFLFAANNPQTWSGYSELFSQWRGAGLAEEMRDRLKMVASMTPSTSATYLDEFSDRAQACFAETLYDDAEPDDITAYNPSPDDNDAPHSPLPIYFDGSLVGLDVERRRSWHNSEVIETLFEDFTRPAADLIAGDNYA